MAPTLEELQAKVAQLEAEKAAKKPRKEENTDPKVRELIKKVVSTELWRLVKFIPGKESLLATTGNVLRMSGLPGFDFS